MARYSLIMKDSVYLKLLQEGAALGKSPGKQINEILNVWAGNAISSNPDNCINCKFLVCEKTRQTLPHTKYYCDSQKPKKKKESKK